MPPSPAAKAASPVALICGDDEFAVKERARRLHDQWSQELGGMDHEVIDATAGNSGEALRALGRLREALQTLPFFGSGKVVWLKDCNFLGDERAAQSAAVTDALAGLAQELKDFSWQNVRLLVSAGKVDKRKLFFKTLDRLGRVETFAELSMEDKDWAVKAEWRARHGLQERGKSISETALAELVARVGPNPRQLDSEIEKLSLYVGAQAEIAPADVQAICTRNKLARAFALADALGDRDLRALLHRLDEELWDLQFDRDKSEIGMLYGLISKVRAMLLLKEMVREGWVKAEVPYPTFKSQLERIPAGRFPADKKFNPLAMHPFVLHRALGQARNYSSAELVLAMEKLLACNQKLVGSRLDQRLVLQQTLVHITGTASSANRPRVVPAAGR